jgi:lactoylglutathione lyase
MGLVTATVKFYEFLGMKLLKKLEFPEAKFDLYFLGYDSPKAVSHGNNLWDREGLIELTHNYGTENDADYKINNGNVEPHRGFGHTCIRYVAPPAPGYRGLRHRQ